MEDQSPPEGKAVRAPAGRARILLVEDDPDSLELLAHILEGASYEVVRVSSGFQALAKVPESHFDLVLLDVMLPGVDGFEVCHRLRHDPATEDIPVVLFSAKSRDEDVETGMRAGASGYLRKPISRADLLAAVRRQLEGQEGAP